MLCRHGNEDIEKGEGKTDQEEEEGTALCDPLQSPLESLQGAWNPVYLLD